ncbi:chymotrypsin [Streptomyces sp. 2132.2]|uniref:serine protease n=1 Tax=Streptomyces sp. 2132.2 TaxID=2485161 RepID=UPI000F476354|nr:serine protease [Streptomyces sp. 2132.2]ROQ99360.1 chymotrypsin [Streptomyces sp. 2132.2]
MTKSNTPHTLSNSARRFLPVLLAVSGVLASVLAAAPRAEAVVGGTAATRGQFAPIVSIQRGTENHSCAGTLIAANRVLTSAQCVDGAPATGLTVVAGRHHLSGNTSQQQAVGVTQIVKHSEYRATTHANDIAILKLKKSLAVDGIYVALATLPGTSAGTPTGDVIIAGWGATREGGPVSDSLQWVEIPSVTQAQCKTAYGASAIYPGMVCAGVLSIGGKGACASDTGDPVFKGHTIVALHSWRRGCARPQYPDVNSGISYYRSWIDANIN